MQLTINVDETMFKDIVEKELEAFSKEELHDLITDMLKKYLAESDVLKHLFIEDRFNSYSYNSVTHHPTELLTNIVKSIDINEDMIDIKNDIIKLLKEDTDKIVLDLFTSMITRSICNMVKNDSEINSMLQVAIRSTVSETINNRI